MVALLSYISAFGFLIAYFIGGYFPYIAIAAMWACIGSLDLILGTHIKEKKGKEKKGENKITDKF